MYILATLLIIGLSVWWWRRRAAADATPDSRYIPIILPRAATPPPGSTDVLAATDNDAASGAAEPARPTPPRPYRPPPFAPVGLPPSAKVAQATPSGGLNRLRQTTLWPRSPRRRLAVLVIIVVIVAVVAGLWVRSTSGTRSVAPPSTPAIQIAAALPLTGIDAIYGARVLEGIQLAVEEANADPIAPRITLGIYDDQSSDERAKVVAGKIVSGRALIMVGPTWSTFSLAAGPIYAVAGLASLPATATSDEITQNPTTFRILFKNSEEGETLAIYLERVLGRRRATVIAVDDAYGRTLRDGFERAAKRLGIETHYFTYSTARERDEIAQRVGSDPSQPAIVLFTLDSDAALILPILRRGGASGPFLGGDALGDEILSQRMAHLPEEQERPGYFTENMYAITPVTLDSANAETLAFAERFRTRFGREPAWYSVAGYDATRLAVTAVRTAAPDAGAYTDMRTPRTAVLNYLLGLNSRVTAQPGLLGAFWFDETRGRQQPIRIGQFKDGHFQSAPLQIVPVPAPEKPDIDSGAVFEMMPGRYVRLQRVVYTGVFVNEIRRVDLTSSTFIADFYLWLRFARNAGPGSVDPTDLTFPNVVSGGFDRSQPQEQRVTDDGTEYWLWRVQGEFRNDFDFHRYPFDEQSLLLSFSNASAPIESLVYVLDNRSAVAAPTNADQPATAEGEQVAHAEANTPTDATASIISVDAFQTLTQWEPRGANWRRENLVTASTLGDPNRVGADGYREVSGFQTNVKLRRQPQTALVKSLLPLLLMTLIMYSLLYFPATLVNEKLTVAVTVALAGVLLLRAINEELGGIGYIVTIEYAFYVFFGLSLGCVLSVMSAEQLRNAGHTKIARRAEQLTHVVFVLIVAATIVGGWRLYANG